MRISRLMLLSVASMAAGCSSETVSAPPVAPANWQSLEPRSGASGGADVVSAKERSLAGAYAAAVGSQGFAQLNSLLDDEAHMASPGLEDQHGRKEVLSAHETLFGAFDERKVALGRVWRTGGEQTLEWTLTAIHARDWMGVPATHRPVAFKGVTLLWTKDDGTLTDIHVYLDVALVKAQLGAGPKDLVPPPVVAPVSGAPEVFEAAPGGPSERPLPADRAVPDDRTGNVAIAKGWLDALEENREAAYVDAVDKDLEVYTLEKASPARGREEARSYYRAMHKAVGQLDTTALNAWSVGRFAVVEYTLAGEQLGPIGWIPAQRDRVIRFEMVDVYEIAAGKIIRVWRYDNPVQVWTAPNP